MNSQSPKVDIAGQFNIWKYSAILKAFQGPQPPSLGEHELKVPQTWGLGAVSRSHNVTK